MLGGNTTTLAYASDFRAERNLVAATLVPLAWTPMGAVVGADRQGVQLAADNLSSWLDQTFPPEDDHSFVASLRDLEMLRRIGWYARDGDRLSDDTILNPQDVPEDLLDALAAPQQALVPCAVCRRTCVKDHFVWNERQLCAWDHCAAVFGKRGPWRGVPYEDRFFITLPQAAYLTPPLLDELNVEVIAMFRGLEEPHLRELVNRTIASGGEASYLAVRIADGYTLLRERRAPRVEVD